MERIVKAGKSIYHVSYTLEDIPVINGIDALTELVVFSAGSPIMYERLDSIPLEDAAMLTLDKAGEFPLLDSLIIALTETPQSDPTMQAVL